MRVLHLLYPCPQVEKKSKKGKEKSKKQKEKQKEKEQTKKKKKEGKEKKTRGQTPKKKKEEAAEEGDEDEEEEDEEDDEIVLLGKKQARVASAKAEVARMTAAGTGMGRQVRSRLLERDDLMSPDSGKGMSGSGSEPSSSGSSSTSTSVSSSSNSGDTEQDEPSKLAKTKSALRIVKSEEVVARPKKPHFFVETSVRPPLKLPTRATRQEKHKSSDAHQRSLQILEEFLQEYDSNLGQLAHHYKECCKKKDHPAEGVYTLRVIRAVSRHVPGRPDVRRACFARFACCLQPCPWRLGNVPHVACVLQLTLFFVDRQDLAMAVTLSSTAAPRTIQAVLGCGTKNCSSASQAHEFFKQQFPTSQPARAAASLLRAMARCTMGCDMAAPYTEGQDVGNVKTEDVSLGALSASAAREALGTSGDQRRHGDLDRWSGFRGEDLIDMSFEKMADKYERTPKAAGLLRYMLT